MNQKSYDGNPSLYIVPTPIGNLEDITYRAIKVLSEVDIIFSEDTRVTKQLLNYYNINKPLVASHKFNEQSSSIKLVEMLKNGKNIALVTDRGTPIISDPGNLCTKEVIKEGYNVISLPGPTAFVPALTSSGIDCSRFYFYGFLNSKHSQRIKELEQIKYYENTIIFYEAPHRINDTLKDMLNIFGNRYISISREISKKFEEIYRGTIADIINNYSLDKGEFVIVVSGNEELHDEVDLPIRDYYDLLISKGFSEKEAIKLIAKSKNLIKNDVYKEIKIFPGK